MTRDIRFAYFFVLQQIGFSCRSSQGNQTLDWDQAVVIASSQNEEMEESNPETSRYYFIHFKILFYYYWYIFQCMCTHGAYNKHYFIIIIIM